MSKDYFSSLREGISHERLEAYRRTSNEADIELIARYLWNIALCESLYPVLQNLEITLRNSIHQSATTYFKNNFWFDDPAILNAQQQSSVTKAKNKLRERKKTISDGRVIAELTFGFWTSLFNSYYELILWRHLLKLTFPYMPRQIRTRNTLSKRLNKVRHLRNRIFHHEPIWYWGDLSQQHNELIEAIGWINPALQETVKILVDRFPVIYSQGHQPHHEQLSNMLLTLKQQ